MYSAKIIVATHKKYEMPVDSLYMPLFVGAEGKVDKNGKELNLGYMKDNIGENISGLNNSFCELTGLYWAWKNMNEDYVGLSHYRRYFSLKKGKGFDCVLTYEQLKGYLGTVKVFVPSKRRYYIETLYSHYAHTHYSSHLDEARKIVLQKYPEYIISYDAVMKHRYGYMFNMMIMEKKYLDNYCSWLFDILFELRKNIDISKLSEFQSRCYGRISEIMFNVWIEQQVRIGQLKRKQIMEIPCIHMERINWWEKGFCFLKAKFIGEKYTKSF